LTSLSKEAYDLNQTTLGMSRKRVCGRPLEWFLKILFCSTQALDTTLGRSFSAAHSALLLISGSYGKFGSTPEEIEAAAKSAQMHDRIISFPDGK